MHVGRPYPRHFDPWICSGQLWPDWLPRRMYLNFGVNGLGVWSPLDLYVGVSNRATVSANRERAVYPFDFPPVGVLNLTVTWETLAGPPKSIRVAVDCDIVGIPHMMAQEFHADRCHKTRWQNWVSTSGIVGPVPPYPVNGFTRPATWPEQPDPPTRPIGLWLDAVNL